MRAHEIMNSWLDLLKQIRSDAVHWCMQHSLNSSVQFSHSVVSDSVTPWTVASQASLSITTSWSLLKLMSIESVMPSNHLILCRPFLLLPTVFPSNRVFSSESVLHLMWPKYCNFSFRISPSSEYSGLISFRMDWLDLLAVQWTLKSLLQHHSSKASILLALSLLYGPTLTSVHDYLENHSSALKPYPCLLWFSRSPPITDSLAILFCL